MAKGKQLTEAQKKAREEEKAKRFKEIGTKRLNNALTVMRRLEPLSKKSQYAYTEDQVKIMVKHLEEHVERIKKAFNGGPVAATGVEL